MNMKRAQAVSDEGWKPRLSSETVYTEQQYEPTETPTKENKQWRLKEQS
jgi:hypothetical protein